MIAAHLRSLSRRERTLLSAGLIALLASVFYVVVLEPGYQRLNNLRSQVPAQSADLQWMKDQLRQHRRLLAQRSEEQTSDRPPILTIIEQSATRAGLSGNIARMQPAEQGSVRVWFDDVSFDPWLKWLGSLREQNVSALAVTIDRTEPGKVNVRVTLRS